LFTLALQLGLGVECGPLLFELALDETKRFGARFAQQRKLATGHANFIKGDSVSPLLLLACRARLFTKIAAAFQHLLVQPHGKLAVLLLDLALDDPNLARAVLAH
jgi:hypothetical protein